MRRPRCFRWLRAGASPARGTMGTTAPTHGVTGQQPAPHSIPRRPIAVASVRTVSSVLWKGQRRRVSSVWLSSALAHRRAAVRESRSPAVGRSALFPATGGLRSGGADAPAEGWRGLRCRGSDRRPACSGSLRRRSCQIPLHRLGIRRLASRPAMEPAQLGPVSLKRVLASQGQAHKEVGVRAAVAPWELSLVKSIVERAALIAEQNAAAPKLIADIGEETALHALMQQPIGALSQGLRSMALWVPTRRSLASLPTISREIL